MNLEEYVHTLTGIKYWKVLNNAAKNIFFKLKQIIFETHIKFSTNGILKDSIRHFNYINIKFYSELI